LLKLTPVNFSNILLAAFGLIFFWQKVTKPNCNYRKAAQKHFRMKKALVKCWWIWHLENSGDQDDDGDDVAVLEELGPRHLIGLNRRIVECRVVERLFKRRICVRQGLNDEFDANCSNETGEIGKQTCQSGQSNDPPVLK